MVEVLVHCSKESVKDAATEAAKPAAPGETGEMQVGATKTHITYTNMTACLCGLVPIDYNSYLFICPGGSSDAPSPDFH